VRPRTSGSPACDDSVVIAQWPSRDCGVSGPLTLRASSAYVRLPKPFSSQDGWGSRSCLRAVSWQHAVSGTWPRILASACARVSSKTNADPGPFGSLCAVPGSRTEPGCKPVPRRHGPGWRTESRRRRSPVVGFGSAAGAPLRSRLRGAGLRWLGARGPCRSFRSRRRGAFRSRNDKDRKERHAGRRLVRQVAEAVPRVAAWRPCPCGGVVLWMRLEIKRARPQALGKERPCRLVERDHLDQLRPRVLVVGAVFEFGDRGLEAVGVEQPGLDQRRSLVEDAVQQGQSVDEEGLLDEFGEALPYLGVASVFGQAEGGQVAALELLQLPPVERELVPPPQADGGRRSAG
jgi:hypothetical protein